MRNLACIAGIILAIALTASPASATRKAEVHVSCKNGRAIAHFVYTFWNANSNLTAYQTLHAGNTTVTSTFNFSGPGGTSVLSTPFVGSGTIHAMTEVYGGNGLFKLKAEASVTCNTPPPPPPPPPVVVNPKAHFWGPCGDPFYRAVLDNRRSDKAVKFDVSYKPFGESRKHIIRWVAAHKLVKTGLFDVAGRTRMTIRANGRLLVSKLSAPNRVYGPCPTGVPILR